MIFYLIYLVKIKQSEAENKRLNPFLKSSMWLPTVIQKGSCYYWNPNIFDVPTNNKVKIYAFDLDDTLITRKSGKSFAENEDDWKFYSESMPNKIRELLDNDNVILIITNQKGISSGKTDLEELINKITTVIKTICEPISEKVCERFGVYIASNDDRYRKPMTGIWSFVPYHYKDCVQYFCGDAAGRPQDHSSADRYFAENCGIPFKLPEEIFNENYNYPVNYYSEYPAQKFIGDNEYSSDSYRTCFDNVIKVLGDKPKTVCIMVGSPGSGKSSLCRTLVQELNSNSINSATHVERDLFKGIQKKFLNQISINMKNKDLKWIFADATHPDTNSRAELKTLCERNNWNHVIIFLDFPIALSQHMDYCRTELEMRESPIPFVVFRTFYKKLREDIKEREEGIKKGEWITFKGISPKLSSLGEYNFKYC